MILDPAYFDYAVGNRPPRWPLTLNRSSPQARGLAAAWPLFAGLGVGFQDLSGHGAGLIRGTGAEEPTQIVRPGLDARVPDFNSSEMHVAGGNVPSLDITGDQITLFARVYPDDIGVGGGSRIISKRTDAGGSDVYSLFTIDHSTRGGEVWFRLYISGGSRDLIYGTPIATGVWQDWCATYDGATMRLYLNGVLVASRTQEGSIAGSARAVFLAKREDEGRYFNGAIAESRVYARCLSAGEVRARNDPAILWSLYREAGVPRVWPAVSAGGSIAVGTSVETNTAFAIGRAKARALGAVTEADTAFATRRSKARSLGLAGETATAFAVTRAKTRALGLGAEADTAFAIARAKLRAIGLAGETDTAFAIVSGSVIGVGVALETNSAFTVARAKARAVGTAAETDTAPAVLRLKARALEAGAETDIATAVVRDKARTAGLAGENDTAFAIAVLKARGTGTALEFDTALAVTIVGPTIGPIPATLTISIGGADAESVTVAITCATSKGEAGP